MKKVFCLGVTILFALLNVFSIIFFENKINSVSANNMIEAEVNSDEDLTQPLAAATDTINYVALGDSISAGYNLTDWSNNGKKEYGDPGLTSTPIYNETFVKLLSDRIKKDYSDRGELSYARSGQTATELLEKLENDSTIITSVKNADVITLCIGANDILHTLYNDDMVQDIALYLVLDQSEYGDRITDEMNKGVTEALAAYDEIISEINEMNPTAQVLVPNIYNPFAELSYIARDDWIWICYPPGDHAVPVQIWGDDLNKVGNKAEEAINALNAGIANKISSYPNWHFVDIKSDFDSYLHSTGDYDIVNCRLVEYKNEDALIPGVIGEILGVEIWGYVDNPQKWKINTDNIKDYIDIHPTAKGHQRIYNKIKTEYEKLVYLTMEYNDVAINDKTNSVYLVNNNVTIPEANIPIRNGYSSSWFKDKECSDAWNMSSDKVTKSTTLYAQWTLENYSITFDEAGGSTVTDISSYTIEDTIKLPTTIKTGYTFSGWKLSSKIGNWNAQTYAAGDYSGKYGTITLVAQWTPVQYSITFDENGGDAVKDISSYTIESVIALPKPERAGYTFNGWKLSSKVGNWEAQIYSEGNYSGKYGTIELVAQWTANTYTVSFNGNGGTPSQASKSVTYDSTYGTLPTATRDGYDFAGWYTSASGGTMVGTTTKVATANNHTLYAHWTAKTYSITFDEAGGSTVTDISSYTIKDTITLPTPTRTGYTLDGWKLASKVGNWEAQTYSAGNYSGKYGTIELVAQWTANTYTISFDEARGNTVSDISYIIEDTVTLPTPTRTGYTFDGWKLSSKVGNWEAQIYSAGNYSGKYGTITLVAQWTANTYTISFNGNGGEPSQASISVTYDSQYGTLPTATRDGYDLAGWYTSASGGTKVETTTKVTTIGDRTLYAHWTAETYIVTFDANGGSVNPSTKDVQFDSEYGTLPKPSLSENIFVGWYTSTTGGTKVETTTIVTTAENHTLYAHWVQLTCSNTATQYLSNISNASAVNFSILSYDGGSIAWYDNDVEISGQTSNTLTYTPQTFGVHKIYCIVDEVKSNDFTITYYQVPTVITINANEISLNNYSFTVSHDCVVTNLDDSKFEWYKTDSDGTKTSLSTGLSSSLIVDKTYTVSVEYDDGTNILSATYEPIKPKYIVSFNAQGGTPTPSSQTIEFESKVTNPANPTKEDYIFAGWYTENECETLYDFDLQVTSDLTLYAKWVQIQCEDETLLYQFLFSTETVKFTIDIDKTVNWFVNDVYQEGITANEFEITPIRGVVNEYKIHCVVDDVVSNSLTILVAYYEPTELTIECTEIYCNHYNFYIEDNNKQNIDLAKIKWYFKEIDKTPTLLGNGGEYELQTKLEGSVFAVFELNGVESNYIDIIPYYDISFESNGGITIETIKCKKYTTITTRPANPTKEDYIFAGWYTENECETLYNFNLQVTNDLTLYARWSQISASGSLEQYYNATEEVEFVIDLGETNTIEWYVNNELKQSSTNPIFTFTPSQTSIGTYDVYCVVEEGKSQTISIVVDYFVPDEIRITENEIYRNYFKFELNVDNENINSINKDAMDWYQYIDGSESKITNIDKFILEIEIDEICEIYIKYDNGEKSVESNRISITPRYVVTITIYDGNVITQNVEKNSPVEEPTDILREDYIFAGWFTERTYENVWSFNTELILKDTTIYAKWVQIVCVNEEALSQYSNNIKTVQLFIDLTDVNIEWYVNGTLQTGYNNNYFNFISVQENYGNYTINCKVGNEKSNSIDVMIYYIPIKLEIKGDKIDKNQYSFSLMNNSNFVDGSRIVWYKKSSDGHDIVIATGSGFTMEISKACEIYAVYVDDNGNITSNIVKISSDITPYILYIVIGVASVTTVGVTIIFVIKSIRRSKNKKQNKKLHKEFFE